MKHTPGPWQLDEVRTDSGRAFRIGSGEMLVAGKGCCIIYDDYGGGENERKANARLISAAPNLLEAVEMVRDADDDNKRDGNTGIPGIARAKINAAIAKARGTQ